MREVLAEGRERGRQAEQDAAQKRHCHRERQHRRIDLNRLEGTKRKECQVVGQDRQENTRAPHGEPQTRRSSETGEEHALGQELLHDPAAPRSDGGADGKFTVPRRARASIEIRDVDAGDQQHEPDDGQHGDHDGA